LLLRYSFFNPAHNIIQRNRESKIEAVMQLIEEDVPGVKFERVNTDSEAILRIAFNYTHPDGKTWSQVGRKAEAVDSNEPTMNLADVTGYKSGDLQEMSEEYADIFHELGHALGMEHEHQHPERKFILSETGNLYL
jgi:cupin superfamily acireductone dioxygenase involved in methionine salvage